MGSDADLEEKNAVKNLKQEDITIT